MRKVLFYLHFLKMGGAEKVALDYIDGLIKEGYKVDLIVDYDMGKENVFESSVNEKVNIKYIKSKKVSNLIYNLRSKGKVKSFYNILLYILVIYFDYYYYVKTIKPLMKKERYDYTISFYQFLPSYLTRFKDAEHIIWLHGSVEHFFKGLRKYFKESYCRKLMKYDYIITIANEMKDQLLDFYPDLDESKIKMIYNPFDFKKIIRSVENTSELKAYEKKLLKEKYICTVSRLDDNQKDIMSLIKAYESLVEENDIEEKLYLIGDGPDKEKFKEYIKEKKLEKEIIFLGNKRNPFLWMRKAKLFILSSKYEGLPTVLIEALSVGVPVISSDCKTGPSEILLNGDCGGLFEVGDVEKLASLMKWSIHNNNDDIIDLKVKKGLERIKEFDKKNSLTKLIRLLK